MTPSIIQLIYRRDYLKKKHLSTRSPEILLEYHHTRNEVTKQIRSSKQEYFNNVTQLQNMPVLCGKDHPMQRELTPPLVTAADASLGACDLRVLTVYMSWLVSPTWRSQISSQQDWTQEASWWHSPSLSWPPASPKPPEIKEELPSCSPATVTASSGSGAGIVGGATDCRAAPGGAAGPS